MKGVLDSNKDIKKRMIFEVYTDGETDMEFFGEPKELTADLLDIIISIFVSKEENETGKNNSKIAEAPTYGKDIFEYAPKSAGADAYRAVAKEIIEREG